MKRAAVVALLVALAIGAPACAQEAAPPPEDAAKELVVHLAAEDAGVRQEASRDLRKLRRKALPALREGTRSPDPEVAAACREIIDVLERSAMRIEGGPLPPGTPWWKARDAKVSVDFRDTPIPEILMAASEDLGIRIKVLPPATNLAERRVTVKFDGAPLEFVLQWLLFKSLEGGAPGAPRLGWQKREEGNEALLSSEAKPSGERVKVEYGREDALKGIGEGDLRALKQFLEELGHGDAATASVKITETGLRVEASPYVQVDASRMIDDFRRAAAGEKAPGADLDAEMIAAGEKLVMVNWQQVPVEDALRELGEKTGGRWCVDRRATQWGGFDAWYQSPQNEPARLVAKTLADRWPMARLEEKWGAWWIFVEAGGAGSETVVRPAGEFVRRMMMSDPAWQPGGIEPWLKARKPPNGGWARGGPTVVTYFPESARIAVCGPHQLVDALDSLLSSRIQEGEARAARLEGRAVVAEATLGAAEVDRRIGARLARERITKEFDSASFRENEFYQEVFRYLHDTIPVNSTSGSLNGRNAADHTIRACRLKDVSTRVIWQWLNEGSIPWYLYYYPERRNAAWGIGMAANWETSAASSPLNRSRLHPSWDKSFLALMESWNPEAKKAFLAEPGTPGGLKNGPIKLPRPPAETFCAALGLETEAGSPEAPTAFDPPAWLDAEISWPEGERTLEETVQKVSELAEFSFVLDVPSGAGPTRKVKWEAAKRTPRSVLDEAVKAAGVSWAVRDEGVVWVRIVPTGTKEWVWLEGGVKLGAAEAEAVALEFAKTGDELVCFAPTGRFAARCVGARSAGAQAAFQKARTDAREACREEAAGLAADAKAGKDVPEGLAGSMALEAAAVGGSREASFTLARRLAAGGHFRAAFRRFSDLAAVGGDPPLLSARAAAAASAMAATFGPCDPGMDAEVVRLAQEALGHADLPADSAGEALGALAEAWRRAGDRDRALDCYRRLAELGMENEDTKRWRSRLEGLPAGR
ncbi:MAG: hypothetical protein K8T20_07965 [Planctomycetes bacterium]|nr:hypothetical protein [Planctomycetota bacterium]